jgi:hypothetical protein
MSIAVIYHTFSMTVLYVPILSPISFVFRVLLAITQNAQESK